MPAEQILSNARLVLADQVIHGSLLIRDGLIADISAGASSLPQAQDLDGALLLPGLVGAAHRARAPASTGHPPRQC